MLLFSMWSYAWRRPSIRKKQGFKQIQTCVKLKSKKDLINDYQVGVNKILSHVIPNRSGLD